MVWLIFFSLFFLLSFKIQVGLSISGFVSIFKNDIFSNANESLFFFFFAVLCDFVVNEFECEINSTVFCCRKPGGQIRTSRGNSLAFHSLDRSCGPKTNGTSGLREISSPLRSDSTHASLLPRAETPVNSPSTSNDGSPVSNLQISLIGQFKGFSISPMNPTSPTRYAGDPVQGASALPSATEPASSSPVQSSLRKAPAPPSVPVVSSKTPPRPTPVKSQGGNKIRSNPTIPTAVSSINNSSVVPALPPSNSQNVGRPLISSPILDATTSSTARELVDGPNTPAATSTSSNVSSAPVRAAPAVPSAQNKNSRPLTTSLSTIQTVAGVDKTGGNKSANYPTLTKLASMLRPSASFKAQEKREEPQNVKAGKLLDKEKLRSLQISSPIPQQEIDVPHAVPVQPNQPVVMRAQSMRAGAHAKRPAIHSFGSMRQPGKRPPSVASNNLHRPTSPPPPRPPPPPEVSSEDTGIIGLPGYQNPPEVKTNKLASDYSYDDCLNVMGEAPLAHIDEGISPCSGDNIYAVIEESPENGGRNRVNFGLTASASAVDVPEYISPTASVYKAPIASQPQIQSAGSSESMGLLGEIVSAIQARNTESIYSSSSVPPQEGLNKNESEFLPLDTSENINKNFLAKEISPSPGNYLNSASSSGYLSPNVTNTGLKTVGGIVSALQSPSTAAPATITTSTNSTTTASSGLSSVEPYKPFGSSLRSRGPLASTFSKLNPSTVPTPPLASLKPQLQTKKPVINSSSQSLPQEQKASQHSNDGAIKERLSLTSTSPDVVSSCSSSADTSSPDVISPASGSKLVQLSDSETKVLGTVATSASESANPKASSKVTTVNAPVSSNPISAINTRSSSVRPPISAAKPNLDCTGNSRTSNPQSRAVASKISNVASLQQKFEGGSSAKLTPAVKPRIQQVKPHLPSK